MANIDPRAFDEPFNDKDLSTELDQHKFLSQAPTTDPDYNDEATRMANIDGIAAMERARKGKVEQPPQDERTRAVNIRSDKSISDIDWDLD